VALVREWARRLGSAGISFNAMHPGWADTPGLRESLPGFTRLMRPVLRTAAECIDTLVWLASEPEVAGDGGALFHDRRPRSFDRLPATRVRAADRRRLWDRIVELTGSPDPAPNR
jgi:NAD(P)-dependent dehydrogenase (short-subunit alcohol dehydrogenase family)